eukprot:XP_010663855.2 PREDICTED: uncharacterized protein LOC104882296 isoform X1 [Vitis vinifera]
MDKRKKTIQYNQEVKINNRCSSKKLRHLLDELSDEKKSIIQHIGFGGLLQLSSTEIRHSLCRWIITHFNIAHCRLDIGQERQFPITCSDVGEILGIPYIGRRLLLSPTNRNNRMENLSDLRDRLILMEDMAEFKKLFIFFSCATLLAPTSKLDSSHELWCTLLAGDFDINVNWGQFVLDTLVAGIRHFRLGKGSWFTGCLIFLQLFYVNKFYIPTMLVPRTIPICAAWTDDLMKKRVHAELHDYGDFGLADVQEDEREEDAHEDPGNPVNEVEEETIDLRTFYIYSFI